MNTKKQKKGGKIERNKNEKKRKTHRMFCAYGNVCYKQHDGIFSGGTHLRYVRFFTKPQGKFHDENRTIILTILTN